MTTQWLKRRILDLINKKKKNQKTRVQTKIKINCIDLIVGIYQSVVTYVYIDSRA
jgi:hypothetical protein